MQETAELVILNARIWPGTSTKNATRGKHAEPRQCTAFAVQNGCFVFVGDDSAAQSWIGPNTQVIDADGARIIPGITDAHLHLIIGGEQLSRLDLRDAPDLAAFIDAVAAQARGLEPGAWLRGGNWTTEAWQDPSPPDKSCLDRVTPNNPVFLERMDLHSAVANSAALKLAGIDEKGPADPSGGKIVRDPTTGEPTGLLLEAAMNLVRERIPPASPAELDAALAAAQIEAHRHGITCVHSMSEWSDTEVLLRARQEDRLTLRVRLHIQENDWTRRIADCTAFANDEWLRILGFKQFMDGSLGSRTAYMRAPFADNPPDKRDNRGLLSAFATPLDKPERMCMAADAAGLNPALHAIGDEACHIVLEAFEKILRESPPRPDRRLRLEHAQHLLPEDIARFASPQLVASMQPYHKAYDGQYAERALGTERCKTTFAFRSLQDANAHLAFGSDWPVVTLNPFLGMHAAITGRSTDGRVFLQEQNLDLVDALAAYTSGGPYAAAENDRMGSIAPGYWADFVILDRDILAIPVEEIPATRAKATYVAGVKVWSLEETS